MLRCFNAPSSNRIGWSVPLATHYQNNVTAGSWYNYTIPAMQLTDKNHVLVRTRSHSYQNSVDIPPTHTHSQGTHTYTIHTHLKLLSGRQALMNHLPLSPLCIEPCFDGSAIAFTITTPSHTLSHPALLQIYPNWTTPRWNVPPNPVNSWKAAIIPAYYLSVRINTGYDVSLGSQYVGK